MCDATDVHPPVLKQDKKVHRCCGGGSGEGIQSSEHSHGRPRWSFALDYNNVNIKTVLFN